MPLVYPHLRMEMSLGHLEGYLSCWPHFTKRHLSMADKSLEPYGTFHGSPWLLTKRRNPYHIRKSVASFGTMNKSSIPHLLPSTPC